MENLPDGIIVDILSRLSLKPLFKCMAVCTTWRKIILQDPYFAKMHVTRANQVHLPCLVYGTTSSSGKQSQLSLIDFNSEDNQDHTLDMVSKGLTGIRFDIGIEFNNILSCNGLLCLCEPETNNPIYVCNPVTGDHVTLPKSTQCTDDYFFISGFGFDAINNKYKVIRMIFEKELGPTSHIEAEVYTVGSGVWRSIGSVSYLLLPKNWNHFWYNYQLIPNHWKSFWPVNVDGAIHWMAERISNGAYEEIIIAWDVMDEKFRVIPLPVDFGPDLDYGKIRLTTYNNCLSIFDFKKLDFMNIWIMKDYNVKESWTKQVKNMNRLKKKWNMNENLIIKARIRRWYGRWDPLNHGRDGEIDVEAVYNPEERCFIDIDLWLLIDCGMNIANHVGSFISVNNGNSWADGVG